MSGNPRSNRTTSTAGALQRLGAGGRPADGESFPGQALGEGLGDAVVVLDDQDVHPSGPYLTGQVQGVGGDG